MRENYIGKMKALLVTMLMVASVMFVFQMTTTENVEATGADLMTGTIQNIVVNNGTSDYGVHGARVSGTVNISWFSTISIDGGGEGVEATTYNVSIRGAELGSDYWTTLGNEGYHGNYSAEMGNATSYLWNTTAATNGSIPDGEYWVNVTGSCVISGDRQWINCSNSIKLNVSNQMPGTPGVERWQGGRFDVCGYASENNGSVLDSERINYVVGESYDVSVNSSCTWSGTNYLFYPIYRGGDSMNDSTHDIQWKRLDTIHTVSSSDSDFGAVTFDRAGIWVIDNAETDEMSDADFSTEAQFNSTVEAWFWVNASTDYNLTAASVLDDYKYNATTRLTLSLSDEDGEQPTTTQPAIVDIRRDSNGSSIFDTNRPLISWVYSGFWVNSSMDNPLTTYPGTYGFWNAGNYTVMAYRDTDALNPSGNNSGIQQYSKKCMESDTNGWKHYNLTYGAGPNRNNSAEWVRSATRYNYRLCGPWDPPEHNITQEYVRIKTGDPYSAVTQNASVYYGFDATVNITLLEKSGGSAINQTKVMVTVWDGSNNNITANFSVWNSNDGSSAGNSRYATIGSTTENAFNGRPGRVTVFRPEHNSKRGWIHINMTKWGRNQTADGTGDADSHLASNGTWRIKLYVDELSDRELNGFDAQWTEEWNETVTWRVRTSPKAQWQWVDDDGAVWDDANTDEIIPYIPNASNVPLDIQFKIYDSAGNLFGDLESGQESGKCETRQHCAANITISGNSLFQGKLSTFPGIHSMSDSAFTGWLDANFVWHVPIIPTMSVGGGTVTITVNAYNTTVIKNIDVGGTYYYQNGSVITVTPNDFQLDVENKTLEITAKFADDGSDIRTATVIAYYIDDTPTGSIDERSAPIVGHDIAWTGTWSGGAYSMPINKTQQTHNQTTGVNNVDGAGFSSIYAPRNITVFVDGPGRRDGYALVKLKPVSDLEVHIEGESEFTMKAGYEYDDFTIACTYVNGTTGRDDDDAPSETSTDKANFFYKIYNIYHEEVTGTANTDALLYNIYAGTLTGTTYVYSHDYDNVYGLDSGTYYIYAYNNTHNSEGHNATLIIKAVDVACDKAPLIWASDTNISTTLTCTYDGNPINGTIIIDNMTDEGTYNRTWMNVSFSQTFSGNEALGGNTTYVEIDSSLLTDGVATVDDITANALHQNESYQYITFYFRTIQTDSSDSPAFARASARIKVEVPSITPDPMYIPLGRTTKVYCTATGRGTILSDVFVRLHGQGFDRNGTTDVDGRVAFSITPASTGNISIDVGESGRTLEDTVVKVVAWVIDASTDAEVNEGDQFTVTVLKEGTTDAVVGAVVTINGIGTDTTDANGQVTFTAPEVTSDRTYTIKVTKEGYAPDPDTNTIMVVNIPRLTIVLPDEVQATTTFEVAVADDTGGAIVGAIITFNEKTYTTGVNGIAKLTAPGTADDYPIKAAFGNYVEATGTVTVTPAPGIPGFELLTLVAALGVAFILFRRRRRR